MKTMRVAIIGVLLIFSISEAAFYLALEATLNSSNCIYDSPYPSPKNRIGYSGGCQLGYTKSENPFLSGCLEIKILKKGWDHENSEDWDIDLTYLELPLRFKYSFVVIEDWAVFISAGPYYAYLIDHNFFENVYEENDFGIHVECGLDFSFPVKTYGIGFEVGYSRGLIPLVEDEDFYNEDIFASILFYFRNVK